MKLDNKEFELLNKCNWLSFDELTSLKFSHIKFGFNYSDKFSDYSSPTQTHSNKIVKYDNTSTKADAIFCTYPNITIAVHTADCLPIFLFNGEQNYISVIHCGWRGLVSGIIQNSIEQSKAHLKHSSPNAILGPSISPSKFEVGTDVIEALFHQSLGLNNNQLGLCLTKSIKEKWLLDLNAAAIFILTNNGIKASQVYSSRECTYLNSHWPSFRRDRKIEKHIVSWIELANKN